MTLRSWTRSASEPLFPDALPGDALVLAESPDTVALCHFSDLPEPGHPWRRIDVFTPDWNLRLQRLGETVRAVAAGSVPGVSAWDAPDATESLEEATPHNAQAVLWGRQNEGESMWLELRIPHLMTPHNHLHPDGHGEEHASQKVRRCLSLIRYEQDGEPCFHRYTGLSYAETDAEDTTFDALRGT